MKKIALSVCLGLFFVVFFGAPQKESSLVVFQLKVPFFLSDISILLLFLSFRIMMN